MPRGSLQSTNIAAFTPFQSGLPMVIMDLSLSTKVPLLLGLGLEFRKPAQLRGHRGWKIMPKESWQGTNIAAFSLHSFLIRNTHDDGVRGSHMKSS